MTGTSCSRFFQPRNGNLTSDDDDDESNLPVGREISKEHSSSPHAVLMTSGSAEDPLEIPDDDSVPGNPSPSKFPKQDESQDGREEIDIHSDDSDPITNAPSTEPQHTDSTEDKTSTVRAHPATNPFAQFAYQSSAAPTSRPRPALSWRQSNIQQDTIKDTKKRKPDNPVQQRVKKVKETNHFVPMASIPPDEQEKIRQKWQSLADPNAPLEVRRFQVLLAARLHARCQEPTVRKAMATLREAFPALTVQEVSKADPAVLAHHITNLQYYNMKAKHLVQSSKEIVERFHGIVPEDEQSLLQLTGIGRVFADLLSFVNTRAAHEKGMNDNDAPEEDTQESLALEDNT
eukprot:Nitzschia sp. Nitz4//scaffold64_size103689//81020//82057//NITZ4_004445-RA/size103689-processed-gene-0.107-mRNA-1//-1//CDS//3329556157//5235//frame0